MATVSRRAAAEASLGVLVVAAFLAAIRSIGWAAITFLPTPEPKVGVSPHVEAFAVGALVVLGAVVLARSVEIAWHAFRDIGHYVLERESR